MIDIWFGYLVSTVGMFAGALSIFLISREAKRANAYLRRTNEDALMRMRDRLTELAREAAKLRDASAPGELAKSELEERLQEIYVALGSRRFHEEVAGLYAGKTLVLVGVRERSTGELEILDVAEPSEFDAPEDRTQPAY